MSFDEAGFAGFELLLRVEVIRVLLDFIRLCLIAEMNAFLQLMLHDVHLGNNTLNADKFVGQFASQPSRSHEIGTEIAFETDAVVLQLALEARFLLPHDTPFQKVFSKAIVLGGILDEIGGCLWVGLTKEIKVYTQSPRIGESLTRDEIVEKPLIVLYFQFHVWRN